MASQACLNASKVAMVPSLMPSINCRRSCLLKSSAVRFAQSIPIPKDYGKDTKGTTTKTYSKHEEVVQVSEWVIFTTGVDTTLVQQILHRICRVISPLAHWYVGGRYTPGIETPLSPAILYRICRPISPTYPLLPGGPIYYGGQNYPFLPSKYFTVCADPYRRHTQLPGGPICTLTETNSNSGK